MAEKRLHIRLMVSEDGTVKVQRLTNDLKMLEYQGGQTASGMTSSLGKIEGALMAVSAATTALSVAGVVALANEFANLSAKATKLSADFEQTRIAFSTMIGSVSEANKFLAELEAFAARTPFTFPELVSSARMMKAFNFETEAILPNLEAIGNAAAGLGTGEEGITRITRALGQMQAKTKTSAQEMMQLSEAGINGWQYIADAAGKSVAQIQKESEQGAISANFAIKAILDGFQRDFGGMMEAQSQTALGLFSTLKDNVGFAMKDMGDVILPPIKAALTQIGAEFEKLQKDGLLKGALQDLGQDAALFLVPVIKLMGQLVLALQSVAYHVRQVQMHFREAELTRERGLLAQMKTAPEEVPGRFILKSLEERNRLIETQAQAVERLELQYRALDNAQARGAATYEETSEAIDRITKALEDNIAASLALQTGAMRGGSDVLGGADFMGGFAPAKDKKGKAVSSPSASIAEALKADMAGHVAAYNEYLKLLEAGAWDAAFSRLNIERQRIEGEKALNSEAFSDKLRSIHAVGYWESQMAEARRIEDEETYDRLKVINEWRQKAAMDRAQEQRDAALETATFGEEQFEQMKEHAAAVEAEIQNIGKQMSKGVGDAFTDSLLYGEDLMGGLEDAFGNLADYVLRRLMEILAEAIIVNTILAALGMAPVGGAGGGIGAAISNGIGSLFGRSAPDVMGPVNAARSAQPMVVEIHNVNRIDGADVSKSVTRAAVEGRGAYGRYRIALQGA